MLYLTAQLAGASLFPDHDRVKTRKGFLVNQPFC